MAKYTLKISQPQGRLTRGRAGEVDIEWNGDEDAETAKRIGGDESNEALHNNITSMLDRGAKTG